MTLDDAKTHLNTLVRLLQGREELNREYMEQVVQFAKDFDIWTPEIYVMVEGGCIQGASANCPMHFNLFDIDNEKVEDEQLDTIPYEDKLFEWETMINEGHEFGKLKAIY